MQSKIQRFLALILTLSLVLPISAAGNPLPPPPEITVLEDPITVTGRSAHTPIDLDAALRTPDGRVSLIVELAAPALGLSSVARSLDFEIDSAASTAYLADLAQQQTQTIAALQKLAPSAEGGMRYGAAFNGFRVLIRPDEATALHQLTAVKRVYPDRQRSILLDSSIEVIQAPAFWNHPEDHTYLGDGVRVAVIDTGIRSEHLLFDGSAFVGPPSFPRGYCADVPDDPNFQCNDKLIAARYYPPTFPIHPDEMLSPRDVHGHGTHVAGIAAGNPVAVPPGAVVPETTAISGVAPRAYLLVYKAIFMQPDGNAVGSDAMFLAALNDAMLDGADVISNSWGGEAGGDPADSPYQSAVAALNAAGIVVVFAAGNSGTDPGTISCPGCLEDVITVGASTADRIFANTLDAVAPGVISGTLVGLAARTGTGPAITGTLEAEIIDAGTAAPGNAEGCTPFAGDTFSAAIALIPRGGCDFSIKVDHAYAAGAIAAAIFNDTPGFPILMGGLENTSIPAVFLSQDQGEALQGWVTNTVSATARIKAQVTAVRNANWQDRVWESSAAGPNGDPNVLKPDLVAPGVNILSGDTDGEGAQFLQGTSIAAPHVAGAAALLIQKHSNWTPAQIKTALTSTAARQVTAPVGSTAATPFLQGAGRLDLKQVRHTGLTFSQPAFAQAQCSTQCIWQAEIKNETLETASWWEAQVTAPPGIKVQVEPSIVVLGLGEHRTFTVTADVSAGAPDQWHFVTITWQHKTQGYTDAHLPLAVYVVEPDQARLSKTADISQALPGETAHYTVTLRNEAPLTTTFTLRDPIPKNASYVFGSATGELSYDPIGDELSGTVTLAPVEMALISDTLHGYVPLSPYTDPVACPENNCDDSALALSGFDFYYLGEHVTDLVWSTNGFLRMGTDLSNLNGTPQNLPDPAAPNHLIAPLWTDLDLDGCTAPGQTSAWYRIFASYEEDGLEVPYYIFEWENAALKSDPAICFSFQVWIKTGTDEIWFVYGPQTGGITDATVGIENQYGRAGYSYFYNGLGSAPVQGTSLKVVTQVPETSATYALAIGPRLDQDILNIFEATNTRTGRVMQAAAFVQVGEKTYLPLLIR